MVPSIKHPGIHVYLFPRSSLLFNSQITPGGPSAEPVGVYQLRASAPYPALSGPGGFLTSCSGQSGGLSAARAEDKSLEQPLQLSWFQGQDRMVISDTEALHAVFDHFRCAIITRRLKRPRI